MPIHNWEDYQGDNWENRFPNRAQGYSEWSSQQSGAQWIPPFLNPPQPAVTNAASSVTRRAATRSSVLVRLASKDER